MYKSIIIICLSIICVSFTANTLPEKLQEKFNNAIETTYGVEDFQATAMSVSAEINQNLPAKVEAENLFKITSNDEVIGYAYLGIAPSKKKEFDYVVMFDPNLIIKKSKVLIYREDYGRQIGSQRWLKQFIGMSANDKAEYGENITAVSGATISASSMTRAVNSVLQTVNMLKTKAIL